MTATIEESSSTNITSLPPLVDESIAPNTLDSTAFTNELLATTTTNSSDESDDAQALLQAGNDVQHAFQDLEKATHDTNTTTGQNANTYWPMQTIGQGIDDFTLGLEIGIVQESALVNPETGAAISQIVNRYGQLYADWVPEGSTFPAEMQDTLGNLQSSYANLAAAFTDADRTQDSMAAALNDFTGALQAVNAKAGEFSEIATPPADMLADLNSDIVTSLNIMQQGAAATGNDELSAAANELATVIENGDNGDAIDAALDNLQQAAQATGNEGVIKNIDRFASAYQQLIANSDPESTLTLLADTRKGLRYTNVTLREEKNNIELTTELRDLSSESTSASMAIGVGNNILDSVANRADANIAPEILSQVQEGLKIMAAMRSNISAFSLNTMFSDNPNAAVAQVFEKEAGLQRLLGRSLNEAGLLRDENSSDNGQQVLGLLLAANANIPNLSPASHDGIFSQELVANYFAVRQDNADALADSASRLYATMGYS